MTLHDRYDDFYRSNLVRENLTGLRMAGWPRNRDEAIVSAGGKGDRILDIGCGNGRLLYQFRHSFRTLVGLEYSPHRLAQAKVNLADLNFIPVNSSAEDIREIATDSIDRIISADTIEHIPDVYAAFSEMYRVLKPGGILVINTPNIAFIKKRVLLLVGRFPSTSQPNEGLGSDILFDGGHLHYFTFRSLRQLINKAGLEIICCTGYGRLGRIHHLWPSLLSVGVQWTARKPASS